jgi:hypothetical protein
MANVEVIKVNRIERANPLGYIVLYRDASQIFNYIYSGNFLMFLIYIVLIFYDFLINI